MRIVRSRPTVEWTQIPNAVARDHRLSWRARGLLLELLSFPPGWETSIDRLVQDAARHSNGATEGRDAMRRAARELKDVGYLIEHKTQDGRGRWRTELELTDAPMWALVQAEIEMADLVDDHRRRDSSRRCDLQEPLVPPARTGDGIPVVGSPVVGKPGVSPKNEKKNHPDPESGRTDAASQTEKDNPASVQAFEIVGRLNLARLDARPKQVAQIKQALANVLARPNVDPRTVESYAAAKVAEARTVKYLLGAFTPERLADEMHTHRPAPPPAKPCPAHPGAVRRADGECSGCWADRFA